MMMVSPSVSSYDTELPRKWDLIQSVAASGKIGVAKENGRANTMSEHIFGAMVISRAVWLEQHDYVA